VLKNRREGVDIQERHYEIVDDSRPGYEPGLFLLAELFHWKRNSSHLIQLLQEKEIRLGEIPFKEFVTFHSRQYV